MDVPTRRTGRVTVIYQFVLTNARNFPTKRLFGKGYRVGGEICRENQKRKEFHRPPSNQLIAPLVRLQVVTMEVLRFAVNPLLIRRFGLSDDATDSATIGKVD